MKVAFRVDASLQMGSGHFMRCLTLADALVAQGAQCHFISRQLSGNLIPTIEQRGFAVTTLPAPMPTAATAQCSGDNSGLRTVHADWLCIDWQTDAAQTSAALASQKPDWLVVDHYAIDQQWESALRPHVKKLMVIDDLADRPHNCDVLLDQNLGRQAQDYDSRVSEQCQLLIGPHYALLRPEFSALRPSSLQRRQHPKLRQLLITMGGVDQKNATGQVLQALQGCALSPDCGITVVMGLQAPWLEQVREQAQRMSWPTEVLVNISDMAQRMADSDLAIGAAGSTSWERCCLGLPTFMVVLAENQRAIAEALQGVGAAHTLDSATLAPEVCNAISTYVADTCELHAMSVSAASIVDGLGVNRLVSYLAALEKF